jgi:hypothetical protein
MPSTTTPKRADRDAPSSFFSDLDLSLSTTVVRKGVNVYRVSTSSTYPGKSIYSQATSLSRNGGNRRSSIEIEEEEDDGKEVSLGQSALSYRRERC